MTTFRRLDPKILVAGQIGPADVAAAAEQGVTMIINNRPDGEEPGQPDSALIEAAASALGLNYLYLPVAGGVSLAQIADTAAAIDGAAGQLLLFCRSGTRSTYLWALAQASRGVDGEALIAAAAAAGYDLEGLRSQFGR